MKALSISLLAFFALSAKASDGGMAILGDTVRNGEARSIIVNAPDKMSISEKSWHRHKVYKRWGWATATVGGTAALTGIIGKIIDKSTNDNYSSESSRHWNIPIFCGLGIGATSVPLFIFSKKELQHSQQPTWEKTDYYKYWKRHKVYKVCAWSALGVGLAADIATVIAGLASFGDQSGGGSNDTAGKILGISGITLTFGSIPLFIQSYRYKYKSKASRLDMSLNVTGVDDVSRFGQTQVEPAIGLSVGF